MESLLGSLKQNIGTSDWLKDTSTSGTSWSEQNPQAAEDFKKALENLDLEDFTVDTK